MCGIAGYINADGAFKPQQLRAAAQLQAHRGPDADGEFFSGDGRIGFCHNRLSIIGLTESGNQPMTSRCGRYIICYNGEIYNYQEVAEKYAINAVNHTDTEVLLESFVKHGPDCLKSMNGMFAGAIADLQSNTLFLFRDRVGIKPLYCAQWRNSLVFASEFQVVERLLLEGECEDVAQDETALRNFLHVGYVPDNRTGIDRIYKFPAGHSGVFAGGELKATPYWHLAPIARKPSNFDESRALKALESVVESAVKRCLVSDVEVGTFLSGGIDSSLVTALAVKHSGRRIKTFCIGYEDGDHDESAYARQVAEHLGTDHQEILLREVDVLSMVDEYFRCYAEPFADSSGFPTMLVSKFASQKVKVVLSGDGGDELFMGYGAYRWAERLGTPMRRAMSAPLSALISIVPSDRYRRVASLLQLPAGLEQLPSHIFSQEQCLFSQSELESLFLLGDRKSLLVANSECFEVQRLSAAERQAVFDFQHYLKDDLLVKVDRASMRSSLEVRVPLLDHELVEFAFGLPIGLKMRGKEQKYLLKQLLYQYVPKAYFDRPKKGFSIPLRKWLQTDLRWLVDENLCEERVREVGLCSWPVVESLLAQFYGGHANLYNRVWALVNLHRWADARISR